MFTDVPVCHAGLKKPSRSSLLCLYLGPPEDQQGHRSKEGTRHRACPAFVTNTGRQWAARPILPQNGPGRKVGCQERVLKAPVAPRSLTFSCRQHSCSAGWGRRQSRALRSQRSSQSPAEQRTDGHGAYEQGRARRGGTTCGQWRSFTSQSR